MRLPLPESGSLPYRETSESNNFFLTLFVISGLRRHMRMSQRAPKKKRPPTFENAGRRRKTQGAAYFFLEAFLVVFFLAAFFVVFFAFLAIFFLQC